MAHSSEEPSTRRDLDRRIDKIFKVMVATTLTAFIVMVGESVVGGDGFWAFLFVTFFTIPVIAYGFAAWMSLERQKEKLSDRD